MCHTLEQVLGQIMMSKNCSWPHGAYDLVYNIDVNPVLLSIKVKITIENLLQTDVHSIMRKTT